MENNDKKTGTQPYTHHAYIFRNYGAPRRSQTRRPGWWQHEGWARLEPDGEIYVFLHSTPLGGFEGSIRCVEFSKPQPAQPDWVLAGEDAEPAPQRPGEEGDDAGGED